MAEFVAVTGTCNNGENRWKNSLLQRACVLLLQGIGEDVSREGLLDTPSRVSKAWQHLFRGYDMDPKSLFVSFENPSAEKPGAVDGMVILKDIEFHSTCEHHLMPFVGRASIGYLPKSRVIGISKLARLLDVYACRLQIQERIGMQVCQQIMEHLKPLGCGCVIEASHSCISCRGVNKQHPSMITSTLLGNFRNDAVRSEFFRLIGK